MTNIELLIASLKVKVVHAIEGTAKSAGLEVAHHGWDRLVVSGDIAVLQAWIDNYLQDICEECCMEVMDIIAV